MESKEAMERFEEAAEATEKREVFARRGVVVVAVLAALLAISTIAANRAGEAAILAQGQATDTYNEFLVNTLKAQANNNVITILENLAKGTTNEGLAGTEVAKLKADNEHFLDNEQKLLPRANAFKRGRDVAEARHKDLQLSEGAFQIGIVVTSIAIVAGSTWLLYVSGASGLAGLVLLVNGFWTFFKIPSIG